MELSITLASQFEISTYPDLLEKVCAFVQEEIRSPSLPPLPTFTFWMENGSQFSGVPLKIMGKDPNKFLSLINSDPIERPISTVIIPFAKIQSLQITPSEAILGILLNRQQTAHANLKLISLNQIRYSFEVQWKEVATRNGLLPYIYFNWDEVGNSEFEKQNIVTISNALVKAIDLVTKVESKKWVFNKLQTLQISNAPVKDIQIEKQGAFLYLKANFLRAPALSIEKELVVLLNDSLV